MHCTAEHGGRMCVWFQSVSRSAAMTDDTLELIYDSKFRRLTMEMTALRAGGTLWCLGAGVEPHTLVLGVEDEGK